MLHPSKTIHLSKLVYPRSQQHNKGNWSLAETVKTCRLVTRRIMAITDVPISIITSWVASTSRKCHWDNYGELARFSVKSCHSKGKWFHDNKYTQPAVPIFWWGRCVLVYIEAGGSTREKTKKCEWQKVCSNLAGLPCQAIWQRQAW